VGGGARAAGDSEGVARPRGRRRRGEARLQRLADAYAAKYDQLFRFTVRDGAFYGKGSGGEVLVYELAPTTALGFGKGTYSQTRLRF
jgi:hypothetical protein